MKENQHDYRVEYSEESAAHDESCKMSGPFLAWIYFLVFLSLL